MNLFIAILLVFALAGLCDKIFGGRWHLASAFDQGLNTMGSLCLSMSGIYCIAITFLNGQTALFQRLNEILPFDASILSFWRRTWAALPLRAKSQPVRSLVCFPVFCFLLPLAAF